MFRLLRFWEFVDFCNWILLVAVLLNLYARLSLVQFGIT